jgi:uncharacterized protein (TIGR02246 family)
MKTAELATPQEAEAAFYAAFQQKDLEAMMAVWALEEDIICVHPLGPVLRGRQAIRQSWQAIFQGSTKMTFRIESQRQMQTDRLAIHMVYEHIRALDQRHTVTATNAYRLTSGGWRMILHHASPAPATDPGSRPIVH